MISNIIKMIKTSEHLDKKQELTFNISTAALRASQLCNQLTNM